VLGEPLLSRFDLVFDYAGGKLWLKPLADRAPVPFNRSGLLLSKAADGSFRVAGVMAGSPAAQEGLRSDDVIDDVDGHPAASLSKSDVMAMFQQAAGTRVGMRLRKSVTEPDRLVTIRLRDVL
jgi:C-terminal processing protease CtpA/Prc